MQRLYPNGSWQSAQILVDAVWRKPVAPAVSYDQGDGTMRIYRRKSDGSSFNRTADYDPGAFSLANVGDRLVLGNW